MALKPPPEKTIQHKNKEIEKVINKGGKVAEESGKEEIAQKEEWTMITVRLPKWMLKDIDKETDDRPGLSRNAWILESLQEKLKDENG